MRYFYYSPLLLVQMSIQKHLFNTSLTQNILYITRVRLIALKLLEICSKRLALKNLDLLNCML